MMIEEFQKEVIRVFSEMDKMPNRQKHTKQTALIHLMEEIGEISRQLTNEYHRPEKFNKENLATELADVMMFVVLLADYYDVNLPKEMKEATERVENKIKIMKND